MGKGPSVIKNIDVSKEKNKNIPQGETKVIPMGHTKLYHRTSGEERQSSTKKR